MKKFSIIISFLFTFLLLSGQDENTNMVKYTPDFKFEEGFFINFQQVKNNNPIPPSRVVTNLDYSSNSFYNEILKQKTLTFFDKVGAKHQVSLSDIWGFSRNGVLYIRVSQGFHRITIIGGIGHFVADITTYESDYYDPYYYRMYNPYYSPYGYQPRTTQKTEMRQYLINFETGKLFDYDRESLEVLLMKDPELHDEYQELRRRKKKQLKFMYIRKFNERNPIYFPESKY